MLIGELMLLDNSTFIYTPWVPAGGSKAVFPIDVLQRIGGTPTDLLVLPQTRTSSDASTISDLGSEVTISSTGVSNVTVTSGIKELVRLRVRTSATGSAGAWLRVFFMPPTFEP